MANINDYLEVYGNLSFLENTFNEIDYLILDRLSFVRFENILKKIEKETIENLYSISTSFTKNVIK